MLHLLALSATVATIDVSKLYKGRVVAESSLQVEVSRGVYTLDGAVVDPKIVDELRGALTSAPFPSPTLDALELDDAGRQRELPASCGT